MLSKPTTNTLKSDSSGIQSYLLGIIVSSEPSTIIMRRGCRPSLLPTLVSEKPVHSRIITLQLAMYARYDNDGDDVACDTRSKTSTCG